MKKLVLLMSALFFAVSLCPQTVPPSLDENRQYAGNATPINNTIPNSTSFFYLYAATAGFILVVAFTHNHYRTRKKIAAVQHQAELRFKQIEAAKERLFTAITHELGSPLNSLLLSSTHLENNFKKLTEDEILEFIRHISNQTQNMRIFIDNILDWSTSQLGKKEINPETVDIQNLADETIDTLAPYAQKKKINISCHIPPQTLADVDKYTTKAILRNLLDNALKYTHPGGKIDILAQETQDHLEITVADSGIGLTEEKIARLFKLDVLLSTHGTANEKGPGLGLLICKDFAEKNGGSIRAAGIPNQGSRFTLSLPRQRDLKPTSQFPGSLSKKLFHRIRKNFRIYHTRHSSPLFYNLTRNPFK